MFGIRFALLGHVLQPNKPLLAGKARAVIMRIDFASEPSLLERTRRLC